MQPPFQPVPWPIRLLTIAPSRSSVNRLMPLFGLAALLLASPVAMIAQLVPVGRISTVAGTGVRGFAGDGGPSTSAQLDTPTGLALDRAGNLYFADTNNNRIRMVAAATGVVTTIAGNGTAGFSGDGGPAANAELNSPQGVALDSAGNLYIADTTNYRLRMLSASTGIIVTVAGNGTFGQSGDGGPAASAATTPRDVAVDSANNLYIAEFEGGVRKVSAATGVITTVAGNGTSGYAGDGGPATSAEVNDPDGIALDAAGNLYIADTDNCRIRMVKAATGIIATIAGNGTCGFSGDGGLATSAEVSGSLGVTIGTDGNLYFADSGNQRVRRVNLSTGIISTVAGDGTNNDAGDGGAAPSSEIAYPDRVAMSNAGVVYVSDGDNNIRQIAPFTPANANVNSSSSPQSLFLQTTQAETIISFTVPTSMGGAQEYTVGAVTGCAVDGVTSNPAGTICTLPITFSPAYPGFRGVPLQAVTGGGNINIGLNGQGVGPLLAFTPGILSTLAGNYAVASSSGDGGPATAATFYNPTAMAVDSVGNIYIADTYGGRVRRIDAATGIISRYAGLAPNASDGGDGGPATSADVSPYDIALDSAGNLYIADVGGAGGRVRKVDAATGIITTVAGKQYNPSVDGYPPPFQGDGGPATQAEFAFPEGVALDPGEKNLFITDNALNQVRKVNLTTGIISTVAGTGTRGYTGDGGPATSATIKYPLGVAVDLAGNVYVADSGNGVVRRIDAVTGIITTYAGNPNAPYDLGQFPTGPATSINIEASYLKFDSADNLYIAGSDAVRRVDAATNILSAIAAGTQNFPIVPPASGGRAIGYFGGLSGAPGGIALDGKGGVYLSDTYYIQKIDVGNSGIDFFTQTQVGAPDTAEDPQSANAANIGNAELTLAAPAAGTNPAVSPASYSFDATVATPCPQVSAGAASGTIDPGNSCTIALDFDPTQGGRIAGSVAITDDSLNAGPATSTPYAVHTIAVSGVGSGGATLLPGALNFGSVAVGASSATQTATLTNYYGVSLTLSAPSLTDSADFTESDNCNGSVAVGGSCTLTFAFTPQSAGALASTFSVSDSFGATHTVALSGSGIGATQLSTPTLAISLSPASPEYTDTITVAATVTGGAATQPTGTVSYSVDGGASTTVALAPAPIGSVAYFPIAPLAPGAHSVAVSYSGDGNYTALPAQTQPFTVADRTLQINASSYPLIPLLTYVGNGRQFNTLGLGGVAVDSKFNVYLGYGNNASETYGDTVAPAIGEITDNGLNYQTVPVTGLGADPRLAVDGSDNLYIADPNNARVVEYSTAGAQTNLPAAGLATPTAVAYDPGSGSLFILDSTLGGVIQFNLSTQKQTTVFSGVTGLDPALAADGSGGIYYAVGPTLMFRTPNGTASPIYGEFNGGSPNVGTITGIAFDPARQLLWVASAAAGSGTTVVRLDGLHHASYVGGQDRLSTQIALDPSGAAYTSEYVYVNDPVAEDLGPFLIGEGGEPIAGGNGTAIFQLPYGHAGSQGGGLNGGSAAPGVYSSTGEGVGSISNQQAGASLYTGNVLFSDGSTLTFPAYADGYGQVMVSDSGSVYALSPPFGQPAGIAYSIPNNEGGSEVAYVSDQTNNSVTSLVYEQPVGGPNGPNGSVYVSSTQTLGFAGLASPSQLAADGNGDVWVLDQGASSGGARVVRLDSAGNQTLPYTADTGDQLGLIQNVSAFAVDGPQDLYLGGSQNGVGVIVKIDSLGVETRVASGIGVPAALAIDALYSVYTVDAATGTLLKIDRSGNQTTVATGLPAATAISLDASGTVYLSSAAGTSVLAIAADGTQRSIPLTGVANPAVAVVDTNGSIYAADGATKKVYLDYRQWVEVPFGTLAVGATASQNYVISNIGNRAFGALTPASFSGVPIYAPFAIAPGATNGCQLAGSGSPTMLAPAQSCQIQFQFAPTATGTFKETTQVATADALTNQGAVAYWDLSGTASASATAPAAALAPAALSFATVAGSAPAAQVATLTNSGTAALAISSISIGGANASSFTQTNTCGASLAAGASCAITVSFTGTAVGSYAATLTVVDNSATPTQTAALSATVTAAPAPAAALTPASLNFTAVAGSAPAAQVATLTNSGTAALAISSISIGGANASSFTQTNNCGASLAAGANCAISVSFSGTAVGSYSATLSVADNSVTPTQTAALSATVTAAPAPAAALTPASLTYSATAGSASAAQIATLTNSGTAALNISGITLTGANASDFALSAKTCGATLAAGASCTISVTFTPQAAGSFSAAISVADDAPGSPQSSALSGTATAAPAAPDFTVTATPSAQSVAAGGAATFTVSVASTGGSFTDPVALTASGLFPPGMTVTFSPASVTPGAAAGQSIMTVQTAAPTEAQAAVRPTGGGGASKWPPAGTSPGTLAGYFTAPVFAAALLLLPGWRLRRRWQARVRRASLSGAGCLLVLLGAMAAIAGCGGGFALHQTPPSTGQTDMTYTITVTGTSGSVQHNTTVQITVR